MATLATDISITPMYDHRTTYEGREYQRLYYVVGFHSVPLNVRCEFAYYPDAGSASTSLGISAPAALVSVRKPQSKEIKVYHNGDKFKVGKVVCRMKIKGLFVRKQHIWIIDGTEFPM